MLVFQTEKKTLSVNPLNGKIYWEIEGGAMPDPIIVGNSMHLFSKEGFKKYDITNDTPKLIWTKSNIKCQCQSYVVEDDFAYGFGQGKIQCISLKTGEQKWSKILREGGLIISNNTLIIIGQKGDLIFVKADSKEYKEIAKMKAIFIPETDKKGRDYRRVSCCMTNPVLSHGKIYLRGSYGDLICVNVSSK